MPIDQKTLSLREVADLLVLNKLATKPDTHGFHALLGFLKTGQLVRCRFLLSRVGPTAADLGEIIGSRAVLTRYARPLLLNAKKGWAGTYRVKLKDIAYEAVQSAARGDGAGANQDWAVTLLQSANDTASVEVAESDWHRFLNVHSTHGPNDVDGEGHPGRPKKNWEAVYSELAANLWSVLDSHNIKIGKHQALADEIFNGLKEHAVEGIPETTTIMTGLARVRSRVGQIKRQRGKHQ